MRQIRRVRRFVSIAVLCLAAASLRADDDPLARFKVVSIFPASASLYVATVSMSFLPFVRHKTEYSSTYSARVFPYFFWSEKGRIWIIIGDDELRRVVRGEPVDFQGRALSDSGDGRRVEGRATPTGPSTGRIKVRVFISKRSVLNYDTTYQLEGTAAH